MGNALQDQLLKAGLVTKKRVRQANVKQKKASKGDRGQRSDEERRIQAQRAQSQKVAKDRALNQQKLAKERANQVNAQIHQLVENHRHPGEEGEIAYHFTDGTRVQCLFVTTEVQQKLAAGKLAVVRDRTQYALVPMTIAEKIRARDPSCVIVCNTEPSDAAADDPYAEFKVPDDLMW